MMYREKHKELFENLKTVKVVFDDGTTSLLNFNPAWKCQYCELWGKSGTMQVSENAIYRYIIGEIKQIKA